MTKKQTAEDRLFAEIRELGRTQGINTVFTTFLELTATSLAMNMDAINMAEREAQYEKLASTLEESTLAAYGRMSFLMCLAARENKDDPRDILGGIYTRLNLNNEWNGQYFTPDEISRLMVMLLDMSVNEPKDNKGYIKINEPTCGSGTMVIGAVWAMMRKKVDYQNKTFFVAQDIDIRCVWMAYIQFCLYRIPAVVIHSNTLTMEIWSYWYTYEGMQIISTRRCCGEAVDAKV